VEIDKWGQEFLTEEFDKIIGLDALKQQMREFLRSFEMSKIREVSGLGLQDWG